MDKIEHQIRENEGKHTLFERFSNGVTQFTSTSYSFVIALILVIVWLGSGFILRFSELWLSIIGAITSVITFLMVFVIQKSQNKESKAIQLKLNELLAASNQASNRLVGIEELSESDLDGMYEHFRNLVEMSYKKSKFNVSRSIEHTLQEDALKAQNEGGLNTQKGGDLNTQKENGPTL